MLRQIQKSTLSWLRNTEDKQMILRKKDLGLLYNVLLNRDPDPSGIKTYMKYIDQNKVNNLNTIASMIIDSHEFRSLHGLDKKGTWPPYQETTWADYKEFLYEGAMFKLPASDFTANDLSSCGVYEPYVSNHMFSHLSDVSCFLDIGANLGLFALPVALRLGSRGHVYAFEASQRNSNLLQKNIWINNIENITVYPIGLGDKNGCVYSTVDVNTSNVTLFDAQMTSLDADIVPIVKLDSFWDTQKKIDMIKIDIEGFEYRFFNGAKECITKWRPSIYMEYSDAFQQRGSGVMGEVLLSALLELGYRITILHRTKEAEIVNKSNLGAIKHIHEALDHHIEFERGTHLDLYLQHEI